VRVRVAPGRSSVTTAETRGDIRGARWVHCVPAPRSGRSHVARPTLARSPSAEHVRRHRDGQSRRRCQILRLPPSRDPTSGPKSPPTAGRGPGHSAAPPLAEQPGAPPLQTFSGAVDRAARSCASRNPRGPAPSCSLAPSIRKSGAAVKTGPQADLTAVIDQLESVVVLMTLLELKEVREVIPEGRLEGRGQGVRHPDLSVGVPLLQTSCRIEQPPFPCGSLGRREHSIDLTIACVRGNAQRNLENRPRRPICPHPVGSGATLPETGEIRTPASRGGRRRPPGLEPGAIE